jgi:hypothetical protein
MIKAKIQFLLICVFAWMLTGCKSAKTATTSTDADLITITGDGSSAATSTGSSSSASKTANVSLTNRYTKLVESYKDWSTVEMSVKLSLTSPGKFNASGKAYMKRGEWISISIRMIGFEVASLWIDKDSIVAIDKYHKKYISEPTASLFGGTDVTIADIQDLLMGRAFLTGKGTATTADRSSFDFEQAENGWYLLPKEQPAKFSYGFLASLTENALRGAVIDVQNYGSVSANYGSIYESRTSGWFAQEVSVESSRGKKIAATLTWDLNGAKFNAGTSKSCNIPSNCERISTATLTALLKNFQVN